MTDPLYDAILEAIADTHDMDVTDADYARAAAKAVRALVKPLVWQRNGSHWAGGHGYVFRRMQADRYTLTIRNQFDQNHPSEEAAKAAAEAHHRAVIAEAAGWDE